MSTNGRLMVPGGKTRGRFHVNRTTLNVLGGFVALALALLVPAALLVGGTPGWLTDEAEPAADAPQEATLAPEPPPSAVDATQEMAATPPPEFDEVAFAPTWPPPSPAAVPGSASAVPAPAPTPAPAPAAAPVPPPAPAPVTPPPAPQPAAPAPAPTPPPMPTADAEAELTSAKSAAEQIRADYEAFLEELGRPDASSDDGDEHDESETDDGDDGDDGDEDANSDEDDG